MKVIFESASDFILRKLNEEDSVSNEPKKKKEPDTDKEEAVEVARLDKEAYILAKTDKKEDELKDLSDDEVDAMYIGIKSNEKSEDKKTEEDKLNK